MNRIDQTFQRLKSAKKKAFIAFITAGYPTLAATKSLMREMQQQGVDMLELGVPFSDPIADGKIIQESSYQALQKGTSLTKILHLVKSVRSQVQMPLVLMSYYNPLFVYGLTRLARDAARAGVDGFIVPDLPWEEAEAFSRALKKYGVALIFLAAPTTTPQRLAQIARCSEGFVYYVSLTGVTGQRAQLPAYLKTALSACRIHVHKPLCVGFGISTAAQIRIVKQWSEGVIVGSAIVKKIMEYKGKPNMVKKVGAWVRGLVRAAHE